MFASVFVAVVVVVVVVVVVEREGWRNIICQIGDSLKRLQNARRGKRSEKERERGARKERSKREETRTAGGEGET